MTRCEHCLVDAGRTTKGKPCCELRRLAQAPPRVQRAALAAARRRGFDAEQALEDVLDTEMRRLARLRRDRSQGLADLGTTIAKALLNP